MTKIARISDNQTVTLGDFDNLAKLPRAAQDALIASAINGGVSSCYFGADVTKTGTTQVTAASPWLLYKDGKLFGDDTGAAVLDLLPHMPTSGNRRIIAVLLQAQTVDDSTQPRDFVVDGSVYPPVMDPQGTATITWRHASVNIQIGDQAPSPVKPVVDLANTVVAWVTLSSTEVVLVEQSITNRINSLRVVDGRLVLVEEWRKTAEPAIEGLKTDVSKLLASGSQKLDRNMFGYVMEQLARLNEKTGMAEGYSYSKTDYFLDLTDSDTDHINYVANVEEGIRFAADNTDTKALSLLTPGDTLIQTSPAGVVLPKYDSKALLSVVGRDSEVALSNGGSQTINYTLKTISKTRIRYGNAFLVCTNAQWWQTGRYDSVEGVFYKDGVGYSVEFAEQHPSGAPNHSIKRLRQIFIDTYQEPYWDASVVAASYTGQVGGNTFMMPRSGWVTAVNLGFSRIDAGGGDIRLALCELFENGEPNYQKCLAATTIAHANLKVWPDLTTFLIEPTYLEGGKRYGWFVITAGNHWLAMVEGNKYAQGSFFVSTDGVWSQGNIALDACFEVLVADFITSRMVVNLNNWNLSGGITDIDLLTKQVVPMGTSITYEVQIGSAWVALAEVASGNSPLFGLPAALNARMVLNGTTDLMPAIKLNESHVTVSRPRTNGVHITEARTAPANVDEVHAILVLEHYIEANHDLSCTLLVGVDYATEVAATSVSDELLPDGSVRRTFVWTGLTPTTTWKRKTSFLTSSALSIFLVSSATDVSFPAL
ncbi:hypothetical protein Nham_3329 [Nitrobacter hamburgensis X14]|uniref:Uncharacterized protein n=1 Tax=Nitrobacter hamburgensis (strain DSM 10229 / NCIMB 13809 / X14) TaxID=323097 RepID=Q1QI86_NITHX|nr:hypothetical protein [Nitrobacter hamburgensis]ABE64061.1 hypothetical protein Nham_3329 [Nitrobacter hamburgensis X14]